jgi:deoxyribonuclease-4
MVRIGVHVSIAGSIERAVDRAREAGCDTFQIFTRSPRGWHFKDLDPAPVDAFRAKLKASGIGPVVDHMPYLPNLATPDEEVYRKSVATLVAEFERCAQLGIPYLVTHLGHYSGSEKSDGFARITGAIHTALEHSKNDVMLLLEITSGEKHTCGGTFEDIRFILEQVDDTTRLGVCVDTCHAFAAGYDLRTPAALDTTFGHFDSVIGLSRLKAVHLNDAKGALGSHLDRHEHIGMGLIGEEGFRAILHHRVFASIPLICETPDDGKRDDAEEIRVVRELAR